jgi:nitrogen fixation NifU-like protein
MTEVLKGKTESQARVLFDAFHGLVTGEGTATLPPELVEEADRMQVLAGVRQFPMRVKCATLAWHTMNAALAGEGETTTE